MDLGSLIGLIAGFFFLVLSVLLGTGFDFAALMNFVDGTSVMVVFGGTFGATILAFPLSNVLSAFKAVKFVFKPPVVDPVIVIQQIIQLSNLARKEGLLALEETARATGDPFLLKGVMLIADGADAELVHSILETEIFYIDSRHSTSRTVMEYMGSAAPAWGMAGTSIGLVLMLTNLSDAASIGPSMAVAIITTFYGSVVANLLCIPMAQKMKAYSDEEMLIKELQVEGMLSILNGENPRNIEEKLKAFVSPAVRNAGPKAEDEGAAKE